MRPVPMDPLRLLSALCRRHGLPLDEARALLPLVEKAAAASGAPRRRILEVLDATLMRRAAELRAERRRAAEVGDRELLERVARMLHTWNVEPT